MVGLPARRGAYAPIRLFGWAFLLQMTEKPYLSIHDVAKHFGVTPTTVYRLAQRGALPGFKIGNQWRFSEARLEEWVADRERLG